MQDTISAKGQRWDFGDQIAEWKNDEYGCGAQGYDYFLSHCIRTIVSDETDEERTCLLGGGAGRSSDRSSYRVIERSKGEMAKEEDR